MSAKKQKKADIVVGLNNQCAEKHSANVMLKQLIGPLGGNGGGSRTLAQGALPENYDVDLLRDWYFELAKIHFEENDDCCAMCNPNKIVGPK